ncbi:kinase-like protein [Byssothecium circinans]|uniref:EKC/KEOPS complex subunit BUD32 n=1 Tax=Byssothecium circinans TaxID=147558 RepID=A0A6A5TZ62_9PLEO|nr:kinase-like protein [Byssothecium circinans]
MHPPPPPPPPPGARRVVFQMPVFNNVEDVNMYRPGGHHPVNLGDVIGHKFKIIHKLGNGGFALVWLARDLDQHGCVALKILRANAQDREIEVLKHLKNAARNLRITNLHETFLIHGPNGVHQCLVLDVGGPSLKLLSLYCKRPPLPFLKAATRKLAEGVAALHSAGVCHGDLTHSNVLFEITGFHAWTEDEIYRYLGPPKTAPLLLLDGTPAPAFAPTHVVDALDYSHLNMEQLSSNVLIVDFGEAFFQDNVPKGLGTPVSFSGPELLFGYPPSYAVDLWALGCLIFEIHTFRLLVPTAFGSPHEALAMAIETVGALPEEWRDSYYDRNNLVEANPGEKHRWFDDQLQRTRTLDSQILKLLPGLSQDQHATFVQLLKSILVFEPSHRLPAAEVGKHPWFTCES